MGPKLVPLLQLSPPQHRGVCRWYFWFLWDWPWPPCSWAKRWLVRRWNHLESEQGCLHMAEPRRSHLDLDTTDGILWWLGWVQACSGQWLPLQEWRAWVCNDWMGEFCISIHIFCNWTSLFSEHHNRALWKALKLSQPFGDLGMSPTSETCREHRLSLTGITTLLLPLPINVRTFNTLNYNYCNSGFKNCDCWK